MKDWMWMVLISFIAFMAGWIYGSHYEAVYHVVEKTLIGY